MCYSIFNLQRDDNLPIKDKMPGSNVLRFHCREGRKEGPRAVGLGIEERE